MATTPATFKARFPEFNLVDDLRIQLFLDDAALLMNSTSKWLSYYDVAHAYHAAHLLAIATVQGDGDSNVIGPVTKQEVDDVIIEQAVAAATTSEGEYGTTSYGKRYLHYRKVCLGGFMVGV